MTFLHKDNQRAYCIGVFEKEIKAQGLEILGWRKVPVNKSVVGRIASQTEPYISQVFVGKGENALSDHEFNVKLLSRAKKQSIPFMNLNYLKRNISIFLLFLPIH